MVLVDIVHEDRRFPMNQMIAYIHRTGSGVQSQNTPIWFRDFLEPREPRNDALSRKVNASHRNLHHVPSRPTEHGPGNDSYRSRAECQEGRKDTEKQRQSDGRSSIPTRVFGDVFSVGANASGVDVSPFTRLHDPEHFQG